MSQAPENRYASIDAIRLDRRKRQVARRLRRICPGIPEEELAHIVDRVARIELAHDLAQIAFSYEDLGVDLGRWPGAES